MEYNKIYLGDCLEVLKTLEENSVDSVVCDPPYELGFMGKSWDSTGIANNKEMWAECLRVLKPGGHLLAFSGTRTYHRMACAIEDAGFEVRDMIEWIYSTGFPKSLNIGKAVNSLETNEWSKIGKALDNIDQKSIMEIWKRDALFATIKLSKSIIEVGINTPKSFFVPDIAVLYHNPLNEQLSAIFAELKLSVLNHISEENEIIVQKNVGQITIPSLNLARYAVKLSQSLGVLSWSIFTAECDVREWLNENMEVSHKVDEALKTLRGNKKYSNEEIISVLCVALTDILRLTILNQSKTFQNLDTNQKMECVSAISVIITEYTAENLISNTVAILKSKAVDKLQGNEREVIGLNPNARDGGGNVQIVQKRKEDILTKGTSEWEGWGTALKPAHEPICMARKPLAESTVASNVLKYGTGGINIDESRVDVADSEKVKQEGHTRKGNVVGDNRTSVAAGQFGDGAFVAGTDLTNGRFPANLIHDNSEEVRECFPENVKGEIGRAGRKSGGNYEASSYKVGVVTETGFKDNGNASRFFKSIKKDLQYSQKHAILKLCENNINVNNARNNLTTTSQIELVANIFSALKSATPNLDLLNQNLNALFVEKNADSIEIDFVAKCVAIKEIPEGLVSQQEYTVFQDFMEDYKKCFQTQNPVNVEKWDNTDITQIMISLLKLCGYVLLATEENINSENREEQKCEYKSLVYIPKASKSERNKGCEGLDTTEKFTAGNYSQSPTCKDCGKTLNGTNDHSKCSGEVYYKEMESKNTKNNHPTVKPIALCEYLIKMVTPKGGIVLDPFAGSGSTLVAAKQNGYQYIGIEMTEEYIPIIEARLYSTANTLF